MDVHGLIGEARPGLVAAAAAAARALGLLDAALLDGSRDVAAIARALGVAPRRLARLLEVLALDGIVTRADGKWRLLRVPPDTPPLPRAGWGLLADVIRDDRPVDEDQDPDSLARFHRHLSAAGADAAREVAARLHALAPIPSLLDLGGGAGAYAAAFLDGNPAATVTLVDRTPVLALAREALARFGDRARFVGGDARALDSLGAMSDTFGAALCANLLHLHAAADCARIVEHAARSLAPGGVLAIKDLRIAPDRSGPATGVLFALNMAVYTSGGDVWDPIQIAGWLEGAGLREVAVEDLASSPDAVLVIGRAPQ